MTHLNDATQDFWRPHYQSEGPESKCVIDGKLLGWTNCTPCSFAMAVEATSLGHYRPTGCQIRDLTNDTSGGTTLRQCADAVNSRYNMFVATYTGANVLTPARLAAYIRAGRKVVIQGNCSALIGTQFQSTAGGVNHAIEINSVYGGTASVPDRADVFDPAADGRKRSYHVDQGPSIWPWSLVLKFASHLRPTGETGARLGPGKIYAAVFPDSEPHVVLDPGAHKSKPFPDRTRVARPSIGIYAAPSSSSKKLYSASKGTLLVGYQYATGNSSWGSTIWLGNDDGTEWVPTGALSYVGGST